MIRFLLAFTLFLLPAAAEARFSNADVSLARQVKEYSDRGDWQSAHEAGMRSQNNVVRQFTWWYRIRAKDGNANFNEIRDFMLRNPEWPDRETMTIRAEKSLTGDHPLQDRLSWFEQFPPQSGYGMQLYAVSLMESTDANDTRSPTMQKAIGLLRTAWTKNKLTEEEQGFFLDNYARFLNKDDHAAAIGMMIWNDQITRAQKLYNLVDDGTQRLFAARIKFRKNMSGLDEATRQVPSHLLKDPGLIYDRLVWRHEREMENGVLELLALTPDEVPYPEKWWSIRRLYIWKLIEEGKYKAAYALVEDHGQLDGGSFAEAEWMAGWLSYAYLNNPARAYTHFYKLYHGVTFPVSKSRGAYWAGKASLAHGNKDIGQRWLNIAATYPSTYYGQIALEETQGARAYLPPPMSPPQSQFQQYLSRPVPQAAQLLSAMGEDALTNRFLKHLMENAKSHQDRTMAVMLATEESNHYLSVKAAKEAIKFNTILPDLGYPVIRFTPKRDIELALVLSIVRQESEFKGNVVSPAGAIGLMQLMPATAKEVARKIDLNYVKENLSNNPAYNMQLGSTYLADLISGFRGSYILAIASYNAGPGRTRQWIRDFGDPRDKDVDPLLWVERIPITETRNYVQRVLENLQMYRHRLNNYKDAPVRILEDLSR